MLGGRGIIDHAAQILLLAQGFRSCMQLLCVVDRVAVASYVRFDSQLSQLSKALYPFELDNRTCSCGAPRPAATLGR